MSSLPRSVVTYQDHLSKLQPLPSTRICCKTVKSCESLLRSNRHRTSLAFSTLVSRAQPIMGATTLDKSVPENLPPTLDAPAEQPPLFDGTSKLYTSYTCPFAQRVWITRNFKGLQDKIKLVPLNLQNRPAWYGEKVYPTNKVPALEHDGKIIGESLDLIKYLDSNFEGPSLLPDDPAKKQFGDELLSYTDTFSGTVFKSFKGDPPKEAGPVFDHLENALRKFDDGPFFLGQFSLVDIAYIPFIERFQIFLSEVFKYDITAGRPKLANWIEELNKIEAYKQTQKVDPEELVEFYKKRHSVNPRL